MVQTVEGTTTLPNKPLYCTYNLTYSVSFQPRGKLCELCSRQPCKLVETTPWWLDENANLVLLSISSQQTQVLMVGPRCSLSQSFYIGRGRLYCPCSPNHSTHDSFQPVPIFIKRCQNLCCFCIDMALAWQVSGKLVLGQIFLKC